MNIFQIHSELEELFLEIPDSGELTDEQAERWQNLGLELRVKQQDTLFYYRRLALDEETIESELNRLKALKTQVTAKKASIQKLVEYGMDKLELNELNFGSIKAVRKLNPPSVIIDNMTDLPKEYTRETITVYVDKNKIKDAIKSGLQVEGARLVQNSRIEIK